MTQHTYKTIKGEARAEIVEKKSRFIAHVAHVEAEKEALDFLERIRAEHRMARHNVYAYVLHAGDRVRYSDDGEPQKTAGLPTLEVIKHAGLFDVIVVTTRYFGGTLLGTGGLVRAYTQAAQAGIAGAECVTISLCVKVVVELAYEYYEQAIRIAEQLDTKVQETAFTDVVTIHLVMLQGDEIEFQQRINELTRGTALIETKEPSMRAW